MQKRQNNRRGWSRAEKALIGAFAVFALLGTAGFVLWQNANAVPTVRIPPPPPLPNPNAYDFYVRAGNLAQETDVTIAGNSRGNSFIRKFGRPPTRAEEDAELARNAPALRTLRQGFAFSSRQPAVRSFTQPFPEYAKFRSLARLLAFEARVKSGRGDHAGAVSSGLDALRLGEDVPRGGALIGELVGIAVSAIGRAPVWKEANHLGAAEARAAARRLEAMYVRQASYADALENEKWIAQAFLSSEFRTKSTAQIARDWTGMGAAGNTGTDLRGWLDAARLQFQLLRTSKRCILRDNAAYMNTLITSARRPYALRGPLPPVPPDPVNQIIVPVFSSARLRDVNHQTANALLLCVLALRAYRVEHGRYPARLDELVSAGYLSRLPEDPCAPSGPVRYRPVPGKNRYVLYSVGADGRDDNGKPAINTLSGGQHKRGMEENDKGDFVVGVNAY